MSRRLFIQQRLIATGLSVALAVQGSWIRSARAGDADEFIQKTHKLADGIATSQVNMLLLNALQTAASMSTKLDVEKAYQEMTTRGALIRGDQAKLNRLYLVATDGKSTLTGQQLTQIYSEFTTVMSRIATQQLSLDGIRRDGFAYRGTLHRIATNFVKNLDQVCANGLYINPYDQIRPSLQALMTPYEVRLSMEFDGDGRARYDPDRSGVSIGKNDEEKAAAALVYAGSVILSAYLLTGTWYVSAGAFAGLSTGTAMAAMAMGLAITAVIVAIIVVAQMIGSRKKAAEEVTKQRRMFEERANHETVNQLFTQKCNVAKSQFTGLLDEIEAIANHNKVALDDLEKVRGVQKAKLEEFNGTMQAFLKKQAEVLGDNFEKLSAEEQQRRREQLSKSEESTRFLEMSSKLNPEDMAGMLKFILKDLYSKGVQYSKDVEIAFLNANSAYKSGRSELRAAVLRELAAEKNFSETQLKSHTDLRAEIKSNRELSEIYSDLDILILDYARAIFKGGGDLKVALKPLAQRFMSLQSKVRTFEENNSNSELAKHINQRLRHVKIVASKAEEL